MKMKKKSLFALLLALAMLLALSACGGNSGNGGNAEDAAVEDADTDGTDAGTDGGDTADAGDSGAAFKIGGTGPLTGGAAIYGNAAKNGALTQSWTRTDFSAEDFDGIVTFAVTDNVPCGTYMLFYTDNSFQQVPLMPARF